ncbi:MAG: cardiolipin synthase [Verrucomicrobiales bacterium]|nr:cardiolipin synthase [Verrucomicrobiales bacterium]
MWEYYSERVALGALVIIIAEVLAVISIAHAIMRVRTSQGTWAWTFALLAMPWLAVPLYWVFGRRTFNGYKQSLRKAQREHGELLQQALDGITAHRSPLVSDFHEYGAVLEKLSRHRFTKGNQVNLLIDGDATFAAIFDEIEAAKNYVLVQFFIIKDDALGNELKDRLLKKAAEGVRVFVLYDEVGSHQLKHRQYKSELRAGGIQVTEFQTTRGKSNRFQVNFRNHRKIVVVDGRSAFVGGHNVGDEYMGRSERFGHWRDTHVRIVGPAALSCQLIFLSDWYWAVREIPDLNWKLSVNEREEGESMMVLPLPTGPIDEAEGGTLFVLNTINRAKQRLWIASPYFVPDESVSNALRLAAMRGVDVRIMIPEKPDHKMVYLAAFSYLEAMSKAGVKMYRYDKGFLHQKVMLADDHLASVGTVNIDNRSLRLNFELSIVVMDGDFCKQVEKMLEQDFRSCYAIDGTDYTCRSLPFRVVVRVARMFAPVL